MPVALLLQPSLHVSSSSQVLPLPRRPEFGIHLLKVGTAIVAHAGSMITEPHLGLSGLLPLVDSCSLLDLSGSYSAVGSFKGFLVITHSNTLCVACIVGPVSMRGIVRY